MIGIGCFSDISSIASHRGGSYTRSRERRGENACTTWVPGPGLPGIPLSIVLSNIGNDPTLRNPIVETVLVERKAKRIAFLRGAIPATLSSVPPRNRPVLRVLEVDADALGTVESGKEEDAVIIFRAYQQTSLGLLRSLATVFPERTPVCALKGRRNTAEEEREFIERSGYATVEDREHEGISPPVVVPYSIGADVPERCLLVWWTRAKAAIRTNIDK